MYITYLSEGINVWAAMQNETYNVCTLPIANLFLAVLILSGQKRSAEME